MGAIMSEQADWHLKLEQQKAEEEMDRLARNRADSFYRLEEIRGRIATQQELVRAYKIARQAIQEDKP